MKKLKRRVERFIAELNHEVEHEGKVIKLITLEEVADLHEVEQQTAWKHFNNLVGLRVDRELFFRPGRDYFIANRKTGRVYRARSTESRPSRPKSLILLTERGYLKLVQRFSSIRAAAIQDMLVDAYFRLRETARAGQLLIREIAVLREQVGSLLAERDHFRELTTGMVSMNREVISLAGQMLACRKRQIREERSMELALEDLPLFRNN